MGTIDGKRTEAVLRAGEDWLRLALVAAQTASWEWDIRTDGLTWSEGAHAVLGLPEAFVGTTNEAHLALIHPDDRARIRRQEQQVIASGADYESEYRLVAPAGTVRWLTDRGRVVEHDVTGRAVRMLGVTTNITARKRAETLRSLRTDVGTALAGGGSLGDVLERCAEAVVRHLDAAFARVWLLDEAEQVLELRASAGLYTHLDGAHARVPVGQLKIGRIAQEHQPHLTNGVATDPEISDREWAARAGMVAFAGYPLLVEDRLVGVMALFARHPLLDDALEALGSVADAIAQDVERKRAEAALRRSEERFRSLVQNALDIITILEADGTVRYKSPGIERELGYTADDLIGSSVFALIHPDDLARAQGLFAELLDRARGKAAAELRFRHKDGPWCWLEVIGTNLLADPSVGGIVVNSRNITERKAFEARLAHQAYHDPLTGLPNRALFLERLVAALSPASREADTRIAVLLLDLDGFKLVNDSRGHAAGDELLVAVGRRLRGCLPSGATLARLGGDEFVVLLKRVADPGEPVHLAGRLIEALRPPLAVEGREVFTTAAVGVAMRPPSRAAPGSLLRDADTALYQAKAAGAGSCAVFEPRMRAALLARLKREMGLRGAAERGELRLHYQPKVELTTGQVVGVEALLRWEHPDQGLLHPAEFIWLAEETGLIVALGRWALREACHRAREWTDASAERSPLVCVNLSVRQLREAGLVAEVARALEDAGLNPRCLELEITEGAVMPDVPAVRRALRDLRKLGVRLAIDDFGAGFSSLARLRGLPVDTLKIDRAFVAALGRDAASLAIVRAVVALAHDLGLVVTAEGVETAEQAAMLRALGAELGQGFYFAPPLPGEAITELLARDARLPEGRGIETGAGTGEQPVETAG